LLAILSGFQRLSCRDNFLFVFFAGTLYLRSGVGTLFVMPALRRNNDLDGPHVELLPTRFLNESLRHGVPVARFLRTTGTRAWTIRQRIGGG
jgi:hypothetical protein